MKGQRNRIVGTRKTALIYEPPIHKSELKGKKVFFYDEVLGRDVVKTVVSITGNTLTIEHKIKVGRTHSWGRERINPNKDTIHGVFIRNKLHPIDWSIKRKIVKTPRPSRLTWEEKHPTDYTTGPSKEDVDWLKEKIERDEKSMKGGSQ